MKIEKFKLEIGGRDLIVDVKNLAEQTNGNILVQYGDTLVLATVVMTEPQRSGLNFFPLTVEYEEKFYAAGKILGSRFVRRESRSSDEAILTARFIDRAIRPRFPKGLKKEIQVVVTCLSWDKENDPDIIGLIATSLALTISDIPWSGPMAAIRIGVKNNDFIINPTYQEREKNNLDLVITGLIPKDEMLINMIEMGGNEMKEEVILNAIDFAQPHFKELLNFQKEIIKEVGKDKVKIEEPVKDLGLEKEFKDFFGDKLEKVFQQKDKTNRTDQIFELKQALICYIQEKYPDENKESYGNNLFEEEIEKLIHKNIIQSEKRPDGRKIDQVRNISSEVGLLPRTHGSAIFNRGQTKTLSILTLGAPGDAQLLEGMEVSGRKNFMHHYNFPAYSTGEIKPMRGPGRREIGHGMLAEKALMPLIPDCDEFPYTIRIVTECLSSNGSTSMAAVSSSSLALMDAGVPIKRPVAGIALGLMQDNQGNYKILTDIQGPEDHYGDMDFKIAGTENGICAIQMDIKVAGIGREIIEKALEQGRKARLQILEEMAKTISEHRPKLSSYAPRILTLQINPLKIREVIGPGGKIINEIIKEYGVLIDIEDSGRIFIVAEKEEQGIKAIEKIKSIIREVEVGEVFQGKVKKILDFGAFVEILPGQEGLVHISQLSNERVNRVEDVVKEGDIIPVKVISIDNLGRISLSLKEVKKQQ